MAATDVVFVLTREEAVVFFEWLARTDDSELLPIEDQAEQLVFWKLQGQLEKVLSEPFAEHYSSLLDEARRKVRENQ